MDINNKLIFVSGPYSSDIKSKKLERHELIILACGDIMNNNGFPLSPIVHGVPIADKMIVPDTYEYWSGYCEKLIEKCDIVFVLNIDGWMYSIGVNDEIKLAKKFNKKIYLVDHLNINLILRNLNEIKSDDEILKIHGWVCECESPFEIRHIEDGFASGQAAYIILNKLKENYEKL